MSHKYAYASGASIDDIIDKTPSDVEYLDFVQDKEMTWSHEDTIFRTSMFDLLKRGLTPEDEKADDESDTDFDDDYRYDSRYFPENRRFSLENQSDKETDRTYANALERTIAITGTTLFDQPRDYDDDQFDRDFAENRRFALENPPDEAAVKEYSGSLKRTMANIDTAFAQDSDDEEGDPDDEEVRDLGDGWCGTSNWKLKISFERWKQEYL